MFIDFDTYLRELKMIGVNLPPSISNRAFINKKLKNLHEVKKLENKITRYSVNTLHSLSDKLNENETIETIEYCKNELIEQKNKYIEIYTLTIKGNGVIKYIYFSKSSNYNTVKRVLSKIIEEKDSFSGFSFSTNKELFRIESYLSWFLDFNDKEEYITHECKI